MSSTEVETEDLLVARSRAGIALILFSLLLFATADVAVGKGGLGALVAIKAVQLSSLGAALWLLRRPSGRFDPRRIAMLVVAVIYVTSAMSSVVRQDVVTSCFLFLVLAMGTATFLPWGMMAQLATVAVGAVSLAASYALVDGAVSAGMLFPSLAAVVAFVASTSMAYNDERHRATRRSFEEALEQSRRRLEEESLVSGALARMGRELMSSLSQAEVLERVSQLTTELLGCDASTALLRDPDDDAFVVRCSHGFGPDDSESMSVIRLPIDLVAPLVSAFADDRPVVVASSGLKDPAGIALRRQYGIAATVYVPLRRGEELIGVLSAHHRRDLPFTPLQLRIAMGVAHLASMALENARLVAELRSANQIKSEFVSTMSHELRTPVSVVLGYTDMLEDTETPEERRALLRDVRRVALELHDLIEETLDLGRLEAGKDPPRVERVDVRELFEELAAEFRAMSPRGPVEVRWEGPRWMEIRSDRRKLRIVLKNLLGNAFKFTAEGEIVVSGRQSPGLAEISVSDTGVGIAAEHLEVVFDMFRQADASDARSYQGAGLGLYIVRRFVAELGGEVTVESEVGTGSKFTVALPQTLATSRAEARDDREEP
jgi:signal transduction histidine kinase